MAITVDDEIDGEWAISRYMSFAKLMDLLTRKQAFLSSVDALKYGVNGDHLEGTYPDIVEIVLSGITDQLDFLVNQAFPRTLGDNKTPMPSPPVREPLKTVFGDIPITTEKSISSICQDLSRWVDVQCWYNGSNENVAMWKIYGGSDPSFLVRSTVDKLAKAITASDDTNVRISKVRYYNTNEASDFMIDEISPFAFKEGAYEYEKEIRVIAYSPEDKCRISKERSEVGRYIGINVQELITDIVVSPNAPNWFFELAEKLISERVDAPISRSILSKR